MGSNSSSAKKVSSALHISDIYFSTHSFFSSATAEMICIISTNCAKNHINIRILKSFKQIGCPVFRMIFYIFDSFKCMRYKPALQSEILQPLYAYFKFMLCKRLSYRSS